MANGALTYQRTCTWEHKHNDGARALSSVHKGYCGRGLADECYVHKTTATSLSTSI